jgi:hypothetical protein
MSAGMTNPQEGFSTGLAGRGLKDGTDHNQVKMIIILMLQLFSLAQKLSFLAF